MVQGVGFEPTKAEPTDLQSAVFDRFTNPARFWSRQRRKANVLAFCRRERSVVQKAVGFWSRQRDSNPRPAVYKTAALATELCRPIVRYTC
jgi:hypothetical protein